MQERGEMKIKYCHGKPHFYDKQKGFFLIDEVLAEYLGLESEDK